MRFINCLAIVGLSLTVGAGCRMCANTYDYANPLVSAPCGSADDGGRAGSILSGTAAWNEPIPMHEYYPAESPGLVSRNAAVSNHDAVTQRMLADPEIAAGVILDISDRPVEAPTIASPTGRLIARQDDQHQVHQPSNRGPVPQPQVQQVAERAKPEPTPASVKLPTLGPVMAAPERSLAPENTAASTGRWMPASTYRTAWRSDSTGR